MHTPNNASFESDDDFVQTVRKLTDDYERAHGTDYRERQAKKEADLLKKTQLKIKFLYAAQYISASIAFLIAISAFFGLMKFYVAIPVAAATYLILFNASRKVISVVFLAHIRRSAIKNYTRS